MEILTHYPTGAQSLGVYRDTYISVTFDEQIDFSTVNYSTFALFPIDTYDPVSGVYDISSDLYTIYFYPSGLLDANTTYIVFVAGENEPYEQYGGVRSINNHALTNDFTYIFTTDESTSGSSGNNEPPEPSGNGTAPSGQQSTYSPYLYVVSTYPENYSIIDNMYDIVVNESGILLLDGISITFSTSVAVHDGDVYWIGKHCYYNNYVSGNVIVNVNNNILTIKNDASGFLFLPEYVYEITLSKNISPNASGISPMQDDYKIYYVPMWDRLRVNFDILRFGLGSFSSSYKNYDIFLMYMRNWYMIYELISSLDTNINISDINKLVECLTRYNMVGGRSSNLLGITSTQRILGDFNVTYRSGNTGNMQTLGMILDSIIECIENELAGLGLSITSTTPRGDDIRFPEKARTDFFYDD